VLNASVIKSSSDIVTCLRSRVALFTRELVDSVVHFVNHISEVVANKQSFDNQILGAVWKQSERVQQMPLDNLKATVLVLKQSLSLIKDSKVKFHFDLI